MIPKSKGVFIHDHKYFEMHQNVKMYSKYKVANLEKLSVLVCFHSHLSREAISFVPGAMTRNATISVSLVKITFD